MMFHMKESILNIECKYLYLGLCMYTDRYYTRPQLAHLLAQRRTWITGTVMPNAKFMPEDFAKDVCSIIKQAKPGW